MQTGRMQFSLLDERIILEPGGEGASPLCGSAKMARRDVPALFKMPGWWCQPMYCACALLMWPFLQVEFHVLGRKCRRALHPCGGAALHEKHCSNQHHLAVRVSSAP